MTCESPPPVPRTTTSPSVACSRAMPPSRSERSRGRDRANPLADGGHATGDDRLDALELAGERILRSRTLDALVVVDPPARGARHERAALAQRPRTDLRPESPAR